MTKVPNTAAVPSAVPAPSEPLRFTGRSEPAQSAAPFLPEQTTEDTSGVAAARAAVAAGLAPSPVKDGPRVP